MQREVVVALVCAVLCVGAALSPLVPLERLESAAPFGGRIGFFAPCFNKVLFATLGAPSAGPYIWSAATRTYQNGPPRRSGQWLLGLKGVPYFCVITIFPLTSIPGTHIMMMGSSN
jgi:hypothetical protein